MKRGSKFVGHSTEIIRQSKIKGPLPLLQKNLETPHPLGITMSQARSYPGSKIHPLFM